MLDRRCIGRSVHVKIASDIDNVRVVHLITETHLPITGVQYINVELKRMFNLDSSTSEKPVMNVDDVYPLLYHHWVVDTATFPNGRQRRQLAFLVLLTGYTATRPSALVYVRRNETKIKGHCIGEDDEEEEEEGEGEGEHKGKDDRAGDWDDERDKTLCYGNVTLLLLPRTPP